jgi:hypothetical protein
LFDRKKMGGGEIMVKKKEKGERMGVCAGGVSDGRIKPGHHSWNVGLPVLGVPGGKVKVWGSR